MRKRNEFFIFRKTPRLRRQVEELMRKRGFFSYSEMFRTLVREDLERLEKTEGRSTAE